MKILFKFPSRSRPEKMIKTLENLYDKLSLSSNYVVSMNLDLNDRTVNNEKIIEQIKSFPQIIVEWGHSSSKIHAINRDIPKTGWDILVLLSDDMELLEKDFDEIIRQDFTDAQTLDTVIYYTDGFTEGIVSFPVIGKTWFDRYGYIYHPQYLSLFCDDELFQVSKRQGKLFPGSANIVRHNHPSNIGGEVDEQLRRTESYYGIDKQTFDKRKRLNFYLK